MMDSITITKAKEIAINITNDLNSYQRTHCDTSAHISWGLLSSVKNTI